MRLQLDSNMVQTDLTNYAELVFDFTNYESVSTKHFWNWILICNIELKVAHMETIKNNADKHNGEHEV